MATEVGSIVDGGLQYRHQLEQKLKEEFQRIKEEFEKTLKKLNETEGRVNQNFTTLVAEAFVAIERRITDLEDKQKREKNND